MSEVEVINGLDVTTTTSDSTVVVLTGPNEVGIIETFEQGPARDPPGHAGWDRACSRACTGEDGNTIIYGPINPADQGTDGDFYINTTTHTLFGPKAGGVWPAGYSLVGPQGIPGIDGNTVLYGAADPVAGTGVNGNFYINTTTHFMFGPKTAGAWPAGVSLVGPQGIQGVPGVDGNTVLYGTVDPVAGVGVNGNFYINTTTHFMFGPKAAGAWPAGTSLVGPVGPVGPGIAEAPNDTKMYGRKALAWGRAVDLTGDTMTGDLTISKATPRILMNGTDAGPPVIISERSLLTRWAVYLGAGAEGGGGSNTGSDFEIQAFNDAGASLPSPVVIRRADGLMVLSGDPTDPLGTATKQYVDTRVRHDVDQGLTTTQQRQARKNISAAPIDALASNDMLVNGSFAVSQQQGPSIGVANGLVMDQWVVDRAGPSAGLTLQSGTAGGMGPYFLSDVVTTAEPGASPAAGSYHIIFQTIEGSRTMHMLWGTGVALPVTLAFWSAHHRTGIWTAVIKNNTNTHSYVVSYNQLAADAEQYNVFNIPPPPNGTAWATDNTGAIRVLFCVGAGSNWIAPSLNAWVAGSYLGGPGQVNGLGSTADNFRLGHASLLPGTQTPTPERAGYIIRPYDVEERIAQRYLQRKTFAPNQFVTNLQAVSGTIASGAGPDLVPKMRAAPSVTFSSLADFVLQPATGGALALTNLTSSGGSADGVSLSATIGTSGIVAGNATGLFTNTANGWMQFKATI